MEVQFDPSREGVPEVAEYLCSAASLDPRSEVCLSTLPVWLEGALHRRDYEGRARDVALALASQVSLPDQIRSDQTGEFKLSTAENHIALNLVMCYQLTHSCDCYCDCDCDYHYAISVKVFPRDQSSASSTSSSEGTRVSHEIMR
jgi:hypothetical protein